MMEGPDCNLRRKISVNSKTKNKRTPPHDNKLVGPCIIEAVKQFKPSPLAVFSKLELYQKRGDNANHCTTDVVYCIQPVYYREVGFFYFSSLS
jgi:hypothetical protein